MSGQQRLTDQLDKALASGMAGTHSDVPEAGRLIWQWFSDLSLRRSWGMNGPNPIGHTEIDAYARLMQWPLRPQDVDAIVRLDDTYLRLFRERQARDNGDMKALPKGSGQVVNPAAFDAVFG